MNYQHLSWHANNQPQKIDLPVGKVVCVGRNYMDHVEELNNQVPAQPVLFMKPKEALVHVHNPILIPQEQGACHNELEIAVLIGQPLTAATSARAVKGIWGVGAGLDLTLRDVQSELKAKGLPWERAKSFDGSCPVSAFIPMAQCPKLDNIHFELQVNQQCRQQGHTGNMMHGIVDLLVEISRHFTLSPGDIVMTGTPKGVGPLASGDTLSVQLDDALNVETSIL